MDIDFENKGGIKISIISYVEEIIKKFSEEMGMSITSTPAADHLFQVQHQKENNFQRNKQYSSIIMLPSYYLLAPGQGEIFRLWLPF